MKESLQESKSFTGEVSNPFSSPTITKGLIEFKVRPLQGGAVRHNAAHLISASGEVYPVTIRATGRIQPVSSVRNEWQVGDFLVRIDGLTFEQAQHMKKLVQAPEPEETTFTGEVIAVKLAPAGSNLIELRVRPHPYRSIRRGTASIRTTSEERIAVTIHKLSAAPPSATLRQFGDLLVVVEGTTLEQAENAQTLIQE